MTHDNNIMFALRGCFGSALLLWSFTLKDPQCSLFIYPSWGFFIPFPVQANILVVCKRWKMGDITWYYMKQYLCSHGSSRIMLSMLSAWLSDSGVIYSPGFFFYKRQNKIFRKMFTLFPYNENLNIYNIYNIIFSKYLHLCSTEEHILYVICVWNKC